MAVVLDKIQWLYHEFGLSSVVRTGRDAWIIILQRSLRMFAYGTTSLILALFFASLDFTDYQIGLFMTMTLAGDVCLGTLLTLVADKVGRRRILIAGAVLMILTGAMFAIFENFWLLLFAAVVGVVSATGGDFGPFRSIEESIVSHLTTPSTRSDVLSWYVTLSAIGSAVGSEVSGRIVHWLLSRDGWKQKDAYHAMFWMYSLMGLANLILMLCLSKNCEVQEKKQTVFQNVEAETDDMEGLLASDSGSDTLEVEEDDGPDRHPTPLKAEKKRSWFGKLGGYIAEISPDSRSTMYKLWFLLGLDSVADGMVPYALTNYYMDNKFHLKKSTLGDIQGTSYVLAAIGTFFAAPLAKRLGLVNTMVFTHVPSSTAVLLFPLPSSVILTVGLFFIRAGLNNMDQAPRSAFIAAVVKPEERTAVMGITAMVRTLAATAGPSITGVLAGKGTFWIAFVAAGLCRLAYDFGLYAMFVNMRLDQHEEQDQGAPATRRKSIDEEEGRDLEMESLETGGVK